MAPTPTWRKPPCPNEINLGTYNIQNGHGFGLPQAIQTVQLGSYAMMMIKERNILDQTYCHNRLGYDVVG